jgi:PAT family beta-lactamase induction signal transducer AmpG
MGRRRSWLLTAHLAITIALVLMAMTDPAANLTRAAIFAVLLGFSAASQDIVIDAYRIESARPELQGLMSATYIAGYRIGMIAAGAGALGFGGWLDPDPATYQYGPWRITYLAMACAMGVGIVTTLVVREPERADETHSTLWTLKHYLRFVGLFMATVAAFIAAFLLTGDLAASWKAQIGGVSGFPPAAAGFLVEVGRFFAALLLAAAVAYGLVSARLVPKAMVTNTYVAPFAEFFSRFGKLALLILALIGSYRIADVVMGVMANVFYTDLGFEKQEIGLISFGFGLVVTILGGLVGGVLTVRYGIMRMLMLGAILAAGSNVLFALLAMIGASIPMLMAVIAADNLSGGLASAAFVAYLSSLTDVRFTATQYALFSSLMLLLPKLIAGYSGMAVDAVGYPAFFIGTALLGAPVLLLIQLAGRLMPARDAD